MEWLFQPEVITGLVVPVLGAGYWLLGRAIKSIKELIAERADRTDAKVETYGHRIDVHDVRLAGHDEDIVSLKVEGGWLRGRLGEPLNPKPPEDK